jgi:polar amino acid transport system substrate-binding protein
MPIPVIKNSGPKSRTGNGPWYRGVVALALSIALLLSGGSAFAQTRDTVRLTTGKWQPYTSKSAPHYGFASHIVSEAFALVGVEVEYGFFPWKRAMKLAREGKWDGSIVWFDTEERRADFLYTHPIVTATNSFFHLKSFQFDWEDFEDLKNLRVGGTSEYSYGRAFDEAEAAGLFRTYRAISDEVGLTNLLKGRIDVFPGELLVTYEQIRDTFSNQDAALFTHHPKHISQPPLHLILSKRVPGNERMRDLFNKGLKRLKESGKYDQIIADGLGGKYVDPD